jgi:hypothetical protein
VKKLRSIEIRERALRILGVQSVWESERIRRNFHRQIRLVNPDGPRRSEQQVPGYDNAEVARLLIQAYRHLTGAGGPTTMLENDELVGRLLDGAITPIRETTTDEDWNLLRYYDQFRHSLWPSPPSLERETKEKFGGIC